MSATDFLISHAYKNVWCSPDQDMQVRLKPAKISPKNGSKVSIQALMTVLKLPTSEHWYHVYQIGELDPETIGLSGQFGVWMSLESQINEHFLIGNVYTNKGIQLPRAESYLLRTIDDNVLLAVREQLDIADLAAEPVYLRVYSNAFFNSDRRTVEDGTQCKGQRATTDAIRNALSDEFHQWQQRKGHAWALVNGKVVYDLNPTTVALGQYVEFLWDSSIKEIREFKYSELPAFHSTLDQKQKYLLLDTDGLGETIDYYDDLDIWVVGYTSDHAYSGVYYHFNRIDSCRMVTHRDYSIPTAYVLGYNQAHPQLLPLDKLRVRVCIRESGWVRPLIDEANRIKELYKLPYQARLQAMIGTEAVLGVWTADALESSGYTKLMSAKQNEFNIANVMSAYGYNATSKLLASAPLPVTLTERVVKLPPGLMQNATVYEFDEDGHLLGRHVHERGIYYVVRNPECRWIEGSVGIGSDRLSTVYAAATVQTNPIDNFAYYKRPLVDGRPSGKWQYAVEGTDYYVDHLGMAVWTIDNTRWYTAVKNDARFLAYTLRLNYRDGIYRFSINADEIRSDGVLYPDQAEIPFGQLDLWLNGKGLIKDLDYIVNWPEICIVNKGYLSEDGNQDIEIRGIGFCTKSMELEDVSDTGWVIDGKLSVDNRFDVRDDKVYKLIVGGRCLDRSQVEFDEGTGSASVPTDIPNGSPYQIKDTIIPLRIDGYTHDQFTYRAQARVVDKAVSDYMTRKMPPEPVAPVNPIPELYHLYSPWTTKIIYDLIHGIIRPEAISGNYSEMDLSRMLEPYSWLIIYDPAFRANNPQYVSIHPHDRYMSIGLTYDQWRFVSRAVKLKLNDRVDLTKFLRIE